MSRFFLAAVILAACSTVQAQEFPFSPENAELRVVTWNIENLGNRTPRRSDAELQLLAERILSFEAPVLAIQEIGSGQGNARAALEQVLSHLGPDWRAAASVTSNGFIYNSRRVELLSSEQLDQLQAPPYNSFYDDFPNWQNDFGSNGDPFTAGRSLPFAAEFRLIGAGSALPFKLISTHFHAGPTFSVQRAYEGLAIQAWVDEMLLPKTAISRVYLLGDFNAQPGNSPHTELGLQRLEKENTTNTAIISNGDVELDHIYASEEGFSYISRGTAFVIRPEHYGESPEQFEAVFSDHAPVLMDLSLSASIGYSGSWIDLERDNAGFVVQVLPANRINVTWYTYDGMGNQMFLTGAGQLSGNIAFIEDVYITAAGISNPGFDPDTVEITVWGSLTISFESCNRARVDYDPVLGDGSGSLNVVRLTNVEGLDCPG